MLIFLKRHEIWREICWDYMGGVGTRGAGYEQNVYIYEILKEEIKYILKGQIYCYNECSLPIE